MGFNTDILNDESISAYGKLVYFALSKYAGKDGTCWPSMDELAEKAGISRKTVQRSLLELIESKWVTKKNRKAELGISASNLYILPNLYNGSHSPYVGSDSPNNMVTQTQHMVLQGVRVGSDSPTNLSNITYPINNNISDNEKAILDYLPTINNYPSDLDRDLKQIREWLKTYPIDHILSELEKFNAWWRDNELKHKGKKNFRSSITNWLKRSKVEAKPVSKTQWLT